MGNISFLFTLLNQSCKKSQHCRYGKKITFITRQTPTNLFLLCFSFQPFFSAYSVHSKIFRDTVDPQYLLWKLIEKSSVQTRNKISFVFIRNSINSQPSQQIKSLCLHSSMHHSYIRFLFAFVFVSFYYIFSSLIKLYA